VAFRYGPDANLIYRKPSPGNKIARFRIRLPWGDVNAVQIKKTFFLPESFAWAPPEFFLSAPKFGFSGFDDLRVLYD
jgi:hypothetical protein